MVKRKQRVGLTATERRPELYDAVPLATGQRAEHSTKHVLHRLGHVRGAEELSRVRVDVGPLPTEGRSRKVRRISTHRELAGGDVRMGTNQLGPGSEGGWCAHEEENRFWATTVRHDPSNRSQR